MKNEVICQAKTVEAAIEKGAKELGVDPARVQVEVLVEPKRGFLGIGEVQAKVKISYTVEPAELAMNFIRTLVDNMGMDVQITMTDGEDNEKCIKVDGDDAGDLIGYHGETLDALQYLTNLAANKKSDEDDERNYTKIHLDVENYREKRADTLRALARRMANKVLKYKRNVTLEPMTPNERRIIHSEIQKIEGVTTHSIGTDNERRVVISLEK
ncbi:MAG: protein jag [Ruminococcaceae bacterium]|nr:protein jag [Oscillospiraceae bacterium]